MLSDMSILKQWCYKATFVDTAAIGVAAIPAFTNPPL